MKIFTIETQIRLSNLLNLMLIVNTIGLLIVLLIPEKYIIFSKIETVEYLFDFELFLSLIYALTIYLFSLKEKNIKNKY